MSALRLPPRPFLYTLDQVADLLAVSNVAPYIFYDGRSTGTPPKDKMLARNIAPSGDRPEWRIEEQELIRWFKRTGFRPITRLEWRR